MQSTLQRLADTSLIGRLGPRIALAALLVCLSSCSLLTIKSPEKPLSPRDITARIVEHEYSAHFITAVDQTADSITAATDDPAVHLNALRWKLGASGASLQAASQLVPMLSVMDSWALAIQMRDFLSEGGGATLFGTQQAQAVTLAADLARDAESLARRLTSP